MSTKLAMTRQSRILTPNWTMVGGQRLIGPATGVLTMARIATIRLQHVQGAAAMSSMTRHDLGAVPVRRATWTTARTMPPQNQIMYVGNQDAFGLSGSTPVPIEVSHVAVDAMPSTARITTARTGRHRRRMLASASTGRSA